MKKSLASPQCPGHRNSQINLPGGGIYQLQILQGSRPTNMGGLAPRHGRQSVRQGRPSPLATPPHPRRESGTRHNVGQLLQSSQGDCGAGDRLPSSVAICQPPKVFRQLRSSTSRSLPIRHFQSIKPTEENSLFQTARRSRSHGKAPARK